MLLGLADQSTGGADFVSYSLNSSVVKMFRFGECNDAAQQIVGRERNQRACHRQLVRNVVVARRVNSTVGRLLESHKVGRG